MTPTPVASKTIMDDLHETLLSFQTSLSLGIIEPERCQDQRNLFVMRDEPLPGVNRLTYAIIVNRTVKAMAIYLPSDTVMGKPCFCVGYATAEEFRRSGHGKAVVKQSMEQLGRGLNAHLPQPGFYVETVVGEDNIAAQLIASRLINDNPDSIIDSETGLPALQYVKYVA